MKIYATIFMTVEPKEDVAYDGGTIKDREEIIRLALAAALADEDTGVDIKIQHIFADVAPIK